jgi:hypothetical protein
MLNDLLDLLDTGAIAQLQAAIRFTAMPRQASPRPATQVVFEWRAQLPSARLS